MIPIEAAAQRLMAAEENAVPCAPVRDLIGQTDQDAAYQVQSLVAEHKINFGARVVGRKIGLTSRPVQAQLGVPSPDFGSLFDDMLYTDREPMPLGRFLQPRIEGEMAFVLCTDLDNPFASVADIIRVTEFVLPALEVVDSRIEAWNITITDTIADNASSGALVLGTTPKRLTEMHLPGMGMAVEHRGEVVSAGVGAACLGSPVAAVAWLARELSRRGSPLRAGEVVLSGAFGPVVTVTEPGSFRLRLSGLGQVNAVFDEGGAA